MIFGLTISMFTTYSIPLCLNLRYYTVMIAIIFMFSFNLLDKIGMNSHQLYFDTR